MARSKQETIMLEERIARIRKKNEEIMKRHMEVEADKQFAAKHNALVQINAPTEDCWPIERPYSTRVFERPQNENLQVQAYDKSNSVSKSRNSGPDDGPPPDPSFSFLSDPSRDEDPRKGVDHNNRRERRSRGGSTINNRRGGINKEYGQQPNRREDVRYEVWRAERHQIDEARISRQKTAEGQWKREWDNQKTNKLTENASAFTVSSEKGERGGERTRQFTVFNSVLKEPSQHMKGPASASQGRHEVAAPQEPEWTDQEADNSNRNRKPPHKKHEHISQRHPGIFTDASFPPGYHTDLTKRNDLSDTASREETTHTPAHVKAEHSHNLAGRHILQPSKRASGHRPTTREISTQPHSLAKTNVKSDFITSVHSAQKGRNRNVEVGGIDGTIRVTVGEHDMTVYNSAILPSEYFGPVRHIEVVEDHRVRAAKSHSQQDGNTGSYHARNEDAGNEQGNLTEKGSGGQHKKSDPRMTASPPYKATEVIHDRSVETVGKSLRISLTNTGTSEAACCDTDLSVPSTTRTSEEVSMDNDAEYTSKKSEASEEFDEDGNDDESWEDVSSGEENEESLPKKPLDDFLFDKKLQFASEPLETEKEDCYSEVLTQEFCRPGYVPVEKERCINVAAISGDYNDHANAANLKYGYSKDSSPLPIRSSEFKGEAVESIPSVQLTGNDNAQVLENPSTETLEADVSRHSAVDAAMSGIENVSAASQCGIVVNPAVNTSPPASATNTSPSVTFLPEVSESSKPILQSVCFGEADSTFEVPILEGCEANITGLSPSTQIEGSSTAGKSLLEADEINIMAVPSPFSPEIIMTAGKSLLEASEASLVNSLSCCRVEADSIAEESLCEANIASTTVLPSSTPPTEASSATEMTLFEVSEVNLGAPPCILTGESNSSINKFHPEHDDVIPCAPQSHSEVDVLSFQISEVTTAVSEPCSAIDTGMLLEAGNVNMPVISPACAVAVNSTVPLEASEAGTGVSPQLPCDVGSKAAEAVTLKTDCITTPPTLSDGT